VIPMKRQASFIFAFVSLLILAAPAHAENSYRFELFGAFSIPLDRDFVIGLPQTTIPLQGEFRVLPGPRGGVRLGADGLGHWGQDISYSFGTNASRIVVNQNGTFAFTSRSHQFGYSVLFYPGGLSSKNILPYITAGAGGTIYTLSQESVNKGLDSGLGKLKNHTSFTGNIGAGFRYQANGSCGFRIDARDWMSHPPRFGIPESSNDPGVSVFPVKGVFHQFEVSIAFVYSFGSK
jgi:hypothetical protein